MAESQVPFPNLPAQVTAIRASISEPRFATYLSKGGGNERYALALYLYNARLAKAFMFPLNIVEVALRNAIDGLLVTRYGLMWHIHPDFRDMVLMPEGAATLAKAIERAGLGASRGQVIAELTFDFWSNLFRSGYGDLWRTALNVVFPNISRVTTRHDVQKMAKNINRFRNRVAHHEPILDLNVTDIHAQIVELVSLRCTETSSWLKHHSTVSLVIRTRPHGETAGFLPLGARLSPDFVTAVASSTLETVVNQMNNKCQVVLCVDDQGLPTAAFGLAELVQYFAIAAKADGGMIDLADQTVESLLKAIDVTKSWSALSVGEPFSTAVECLVKKGKRFIVGIDPAGKAVGVIPRAVRRY